MSSFLDDEGISVNFARRPATTSSGVFSPYSFTQQSPEEEEKEFELRITVIDDGEGGLLGGGTAPSSSFSPSTSTSSSEKRSLSTFPLFSLLPPEIRLKVWSHTIFPRVLLAGVVSPSPPNPSDPFLAPDDHTWSTLLHTNFSHRPEQRQRQVPALLHVCQESRSLGMKEYSMRFSWKGPPITNFCADYYICGIDSCSTSTRGINWNDEDEVTEDTEWCSMPEAARASIRALLSPSSHSCLCTHDSNPHDRPPHLYSRKSRNKSRKTHPPRAFFSYRHDTLFLAGDLEPFSSATGMAYPAAYYFFRPEASCVRHLVVPFSSLRLDTLEAEDIATVLFHLIDRFTGLNGEQGRKKGNEPPLVLKVLVREEDEDILGHASRRGGRAGSELGGNITTWERWNEGEGVMEENVLMKIWRACMGGHFRGKGVHDVRIEMIGPEEVFSSL